MQNEEVILNLWHIIDDGGFIHHLLGRAYLAAGSDEEKLKFLHERALLDWKIAQDFSVPERFKVILTGTYEEINAIHVGHIEEAGGYATIYKEVINELEVGLNKFGGFKIPNNPLMVVTPVRMKDDNTFEIPDKIKLTKL